MPSCRRAIVQRGSAPSADKGDVLVIWELEFDSVSSPESHPHAKRDNPARERVGGIVIAAEDRTG